MNGHLERRATRRLSGGEHGIVAARIRPGRDVIVVDVSAGGALIETEHRLLPGTAVDLHLTTAGDAVSLRGRLLRCVVSYLRASSLRYRGAIVFDSRLVWLDSTAAGYAVPSCEGAKYSGDAVDWADPSRTEIR